MHREARAGRAEARHLMCHATSQRNREQVSLTTFRFTFEEDQQAARGRTDWQGRAGLKAGRPHGRLWQ